jgi:hypothetical protein
VCKGALEPAPHTIPTRHGTAGQAGVAVRFGVAAHGGAGQGGSRGLGHGGGEGGVMREREEGLGAHGLSFSILSAPYGIRSLYPPPRGVSGWWEGGIPPPGAPGRVGGTPSPRNAGGRNGGYPRPSGSRAWGAEGEGYSIPQGILRQNTATNMMLQPTRLCKSGRCRCPLLHGSLHLAGSVSTRPWARGCIPPPSIAAGHVYTAAAPASESGLP